MSIFDVTAPKKPSNVEKVISAAANWASGFSGGGLVSGLAGAKVGTTLATRGNVSDDTLNALVTQAQQSTDVSAEETLNKLTAPYRVLVARPLSTAFLASNRQYQQSQTGKESTEGFVPAIDIALSAIQNPEAWRAAWLDARQVSPGQAIVGYIGDNIDGTQATDKIDWTNKEQVDVYFSQLKGLKYTSGAIDFTLSFGADPLVLAGSGVGKLSRTIVTVPVTKKNIAKTVANIDAAAAGAPSPWSVQFGFFKENADNLGPILSHSTIAGNSPLATQVQKAAQRAVETGDDTELANVLKYAVGDPKTIDNFIYNESLLSSELGPLVRESESIANTIKYLDEVSPISGSESAMLLKVQRDAAAKRAARLAEESKKIDDQRIAMREVIEEVPIGSIARRTASPIPAIERARAKSASFYSQSYWGNTEDIGRFDRVLYGAGIYLNPSTRLKEFPSGSMSIGGIAGDSSILEFNARIRLLARLTGKPARVQKAWSEMWERNTNKSSRFQMAQKFDEKSMKDVIIYHMRDAVKIGGADGLARTQQRMAIAVQVAQAIAEKSVFRKNRLIEDVVDQNYTIDDGVGGTVLIKYLEEAANETALQIAKIKRGPKATVTEADIADAKVELKSSYSAVPARVPQVPSMHYGVDLVEFDSVVSGNAYLIKQIVDEIELNPRYQGVTDIKKVISDISDEILGEKTLSEKLTPESIKSTGRKAGSNVRDFLDILYNDIWKPQILASFRYTVRNVGEGDGRVVAVALETSRDFGIPVTQILRSTYDPGVIGRVFGNAKIRAEASTKAKMINVLKRNLSDSQVKFNDDIAEMLYQSHDSTFAAMSQTFAEADNIVRLYDRSELYADVVDYARNIGLRLSDEAGLPEGVNGQLFDLLAHGQFKRGFYKGEPQKSLDKVNDDLERAWEILVSVDETYVAQTLGFFKVRLNEEMKNIAELIESPRFIEMPSGMKDGLSDMYKMLEATRTSLESLGTSVVAKAAVRNKLEGLISRANIVRNIKRSGEGEFELVPGFFVPDIFAGALGAIMRRESSAIASGASVVLDINRGALTNIVSGRVVRGIIEPYDAKGVVNKNWAGEAADHANRQSMDDAVRRVMEIDGINGQSLDTVVAWAKSNSPDAVKWRKELEAEIDSVSITNPADPIGDIIVRNSRFVESVLPMYGIDGNVIAPLLDDAGVPILTQKGKKIPGTNTIAQEDGQLIPGLRIKAKAGTLTADDMMMIPERQRASVHGNTLKKNNVNLWRRAVQTMFKYIGQIPEDLFVRHPFYRMMAQTEQRRIANLWKSMGRSDDYIDARLDDLAEAAHRVAYKQTMERLYSVQRKTNPAQVLRFYSPFYMAKQNSNRFWFGYAMRNPQFIGRYLQFWSAPGRVFDVENEDGVDVETINPFHAEGVAAKITLPKSFADILGIPDDERFSTQLSSYDLINNGYAPFIPEGGGGLFDISISALSKMGSGQAWDPELLLTKFGMDPELLRKIVAPYAAPKTGVSARDLLLGLFINPPSWMRSVMAGAAEAPVLGGIADILDPKASERLVTRTVKNYKWLYEKYLNEQESNAVLDERQQSKEALALYSDATDMTIHEFLWEGLLAFGLSGVGNIKIENYADRKQQEIRQYQERWGDEEGMQRFIYDNTKVNEKGEVLSYGDYTYNVTRSGGIENNPFGVFASPQTVRNIKQNKTLWDELAFATWGEDGPDNKVLGSLFNSGDRLKDYSQTSNTKLYDMKIKKTNVSKENQASAILVDSGNSEYFGILDSYEADAMAMGIDPESSEFKETFGEQIKADTDALAKRNPIWYRQSAQFNTLKAENTTKTILAVLEDEQFMRTNKDNKLIQAVSSYFIYRKPLVEERLAISSNVKTNIYDSQKYDSIIQDKDDIARQISEQVPEFALFYKYYLKRDPLFSDGQIAEIK
jgi:hypothetical protein